MAVTHNLSPHELEKELSAAGWTFFYMANANENEGLWLQSGQDDRCSAEAPLHERETAEMQLPSN